MKVSLCYEPSLSRVIWVNELIEPTLSEPIQGYILSQLEIMTQSNHLVFYTFGQNKLLVVSGKMSS